MNLCTTRTIWRVYKIHLMYELRENVHELSKVEKSHCSSGSKLIFITWNYESVTRSERSKEKRSEFVCFCTCVRITGLLTKEIRKIASKSLR